MKNRKPNINNQISLQKLDDIIKAVDNGKQAYSDFGKYPVSKIDGKYFIYYRKKYIDLFDENRELNGAGFVIENKVITK